MKENELIITDDEGVEHKFEIAFTFSDETNEHDYAVVSDDQECYFVFEFFEKTNEMALVEDHAVLEQAGELLASYFDIDEIVYDENKA